MESNASLKGNPSSSRDPYPQNGFNLLLNEGWRNRKVDMNEGLSLSLSCYSNCSSSIYDDSNNVRGSNNSNPPFEVDNSSRKGTIVIDEKESDKQELLELFPETPTKDLLFTDGSHKDRAENGKQLVKRECIGGQDFEAPIIKGRWTLEEDRKLIEMVRKFGEGKWALIARFIGTRIGKQCRERWENHLRLHLKTEDWTEQEKLEIIEAHKELGCRWAELGRRFPRRSQNSIKNLWNGTKRRLQNAVRKGRLYADLNPLEAYILTFINTTNHHHHHHPINNNNIMTRSPTPTLTAVVDNSNNEAPAAVPVNRDVVDSPMKMMIDHNLGQVVGPPDELGMSEEIDGHKETSFMELLLNSY